MISGKYIGELVRLALQSLINYKDKPLFGGKSSAAFDKFEAFKTEYVSMIEGKYRLVEDDKTKNDRIIRFVMPNSISLYSQPIDLIITYLHTKSKHGDLNMTYNRWYFPFIHYFIHL